MAIPQRGPQILFPVDQGLVQNAIFQGASPESTRNTLQTKLRVQVEETVKTFQLSKEQEGKLELAGRGDIERHIDKLTKVRDKLQSRPGGQLTKEQIVEIRNEVKFVSKQSENLFGPQSLFAKVLHRQLTPEGRLKLEALRVERIRFVKDLNAQIAVAKFELVVPLTHEQRQSLMPKFKELSQAYDENEPHAWQRIILAFMNLKAAEREKVIEPPLQEEFWREAKDYARTIQQQLEALNDPAQGINIRAPRGGMF